MSQSVVGSQFVNWRKERVPTPIRVTPNDVLSRHSLFLTGSSFHIGDFINFHNFITISRTRTYIHRH